MPELLDHLSFKEMQKSSFTNNEIITFGLRYMLRNLVPGSVEREQTKFIRKGKVDSYKEELDQETIKRFDKWIELHTKGKKYKGLFRGSMSND